MLVNLAQALKKGLALQSRMNFSNLSSAVSKLRRVAESELDH